VTKTDLAKYEMSFDERPHHVSEGAQKCFSRYAISVLSKLGDGSSLSQTWFKRAIAKALLFIELDDSIQKSAWYQADRGFKAQIVTYTIAACAHGFRVKAQHIDLDRIWRDQIVPRAFLEWMLSQSRRIADILKAPPDNVRNISEFAKRDFCWEQYVRGEVGMPDDEILQFGVSGEDFINEVRQGSREEARNVELDFDLKILGLVSRANELIHQATKAGFASPKNISALNKIASGRLSLSKGEKTALRYLLERLETEC
jgi:hypothetical protein